MTNRIEKADTETDRLLRERLASSNTRHFIMVAGAGSGKTTSLVKALDYIKKSQGNNLRKNAQQVACITFTEIAVEEIFGDVGNDSLFYVSTIHSFLWHIIKPFQNDIRQWAFGRLTEKIIGEQEKNNNTRNKTGSAEQSEIKIENYKLQLQCINNVENFQYRTGSDYAKGILGHSDVLSIGYAFLAEKPLMRRLLVKRFPIIFIDESQDTDPKIIDVLLDAARESRLGFCLGFFGDPMQKIYLQGAGIIKSENDWLKLEKPENFRCPQAVLKVINKIRAEDDGLVQTYGRHELQNGELIPVQGTARVLVLAADNYQQRLQEARLWLAEKDSDGSWLKDEDSQSLRLLVLVHRIAAINLGFPNLYSALNDKSTDSLSIGLVDGTAWPINPFLSYVLPLIDARVNNHEFEVMRLLRHYCPKLQTGFLTLDNAKIVLDQVKNDLSKLIAMFDSKSSKSIGEIALFLRESKLFDFDDRYIELINDFSNSDTVTNADPDNATLRFMQCQCLELFGYRKYIDNSSPFATQQGIKGAEFEKVLVVINEDTTSPTFSYGKYFGVTPLSDIDKKNQENKKDSVIERTRRLFYVCCSRATSDLAVIVFTKDINQMINAIKRKALFDDNCIFTIE